MKDLLEKDALAYYAAPRETEDIDINVFLKAENAGACLEEIYDRPKDRAEVREVLLCMGERMDVAYTVGWLERILGSEDARVARFRGAVGELVAAAPPTTTRHTPSGALPERE